MDLLICTQYIYQQGHLYNNYVLESGMHFAILLTDFKRLYTVDPLHRILQCFAIEARNVMLQRIQPIEQLLAKEAHQQLCLGKGGMYENITFLKFNSCHTSDKSFKSSTSIPSFVRHWHLQ